MGLEAIIVAVALRMHARAIPQRPVWPALGAITSPFGRDGARWHPGIDIGTLRSLRVRAALPGRVVAVGEPVGYDGYGNVVVVRSRGLTELYAHLSAWRVHRGQRVWAGEHIATAGCTGWCTGTHLHFEVRRDGKAVNPMRVVFHVGYVRADRELLAAR